MFQDGAMTGRRRGRPYFVVIPAKAGHEVKRQRYPEHIERSLDSGLRRNDTIGNRIIDQHRPDQSPAQPCRHLKTLSPMVFVGPASAPAAKGTIGRHLEPLPPLTNVAPASGRFLRMATVSIETQKLRHY